MTTTQLRGVGVSGLVLVLLSACAGPTTPPVATDPAQTVARPATAGHALPEAISGSTGIVVGADAPHGPAADAVELRRSADGQDVLIRKVDAAGGVDGAQPATPAPAE